MSVSFPVSNEVRKGEFDESVLHFGRVQNRGRSRGSVELLLLVVHDARC